MKLRPRIAHAHPIVQDAENFLGDEVVSATTTAGGQPTAVVVNGTRHAYLFNTGAFPVIVRCKNGSVGGVPASGNGITVAAGAGFDWTADPTGLLLLGVGGTSAVYLAYFGEA